MPAGGLVGLIGPNGAGKSTLFDAHVARLAGVETPDTDSCQVYDQVGLVAMALGLGDAGTVIKDNIRSVSQGGGNRPGRGS